MSIAPRDEEEVEDLLHAELVEIAEEETGAKKLELVQPEGWPRPRGYSNGAVATGRVVTVAGQIGWDPVTGTFHSDDFAMQARQALHNVVEVLLAANARPHDLVRLTWYVTNRDEYLASMKEVGAAYREIMGDHYPPMSLVFVSGLVEERAKVEIEATAVIPEHPV
jgi:enamine deaminase RidA (YjgF/YER057c/UK114 family)